MRLLITTDPIGGVWTYTSELVEGLLALGHSVSLVSFGRLLNRAQQARVDALALCFGKLIRFQEVALPLEWQQDNERCYELTAPLLLGEIEAYRPDLLHANQFCYGALPTALPKIVVAHSDVLSWHQGCRASLPAASRWIETYQRLVQNGLNGADLVVAPTSAMLEALRSNFKVGAAAVVLANGRDIPVAAHGERTLQAVTAGRLWDEAKNIRSLEQLDLPMPVVVAGEAEHEGSRFHSSTLTLLGALGEQELLALFAHSAIYVAPALYEPFGLAPLEAALAGCALVLRDIASLREVWGEHALFFSTQRELEQHLRTLAQDAALLARLAARAQRHAQAHYTREAMVERYLPVYAELVQHHGAACVA